MLYFDTSYLVRLYLDESGSPAVRNLAAGDEIACSLHGRAECVAAFHRAFREKSLSRPVWIELLDQFEEESASEAVSWLPTDAGIVARATAAYRRAPADLFLRSADALHLACAKENGFREIYSHDTRMLQAASLFGLKGRDILAA